MTSLRMYIDGAFTDASTGGTLPVVDPFLGREVARIPDASPEDVDRAVRAASAAFRLEWRDTPGVRRANLLFKLADLVESHAAELGQLDSSDNGKLLRDTTQQALFAARMYRHYAGYADKLTGLHVPLDDVNILDYVVREPHGVSVLITAWNSPVQLLANKLAPALAAGNAVVIKPSEHASRSTLKMCELVSAAGFPSGLVNVVTGGPEVGKALTSHPEVDHISFTGGVPAGREVARAAAANIVPVTLELGGKSPNIVFDDANLPSAIEGLLAGIFSAGGQSCVAGSRALVQRSVYREVLQGVSAAADAIVLGDPALDSTEMGPIANRPQYEKILRMISDGEAEGAQRVTRSREFEGILKSGNFVSPTVFGEVTADMSVARQEFFGPVLSMMAFDDEDEAVEIANGTEYGLAAGVWTSDLSRAHRMARRLVAGTVWINTYRKTAVQTPGGGTRRSGYGRERGAEGLNEYLRTKNVMVQL